MKKYFFLFALLATTAHAQTAGVLTTTDTRIPTGVAGAASGAAVLDATGNLTANTVVPTDTATQIAIGAALAARLPLTGGTVSGNLSVATFGSWAPQFGIRDDSVLTPAAAGTGNAVGDVLTLNDGCSTHGSLSVLSVTSGGVTAYNIITRGICSTVPTSPISVQSTTGAGTGSTYNLYWGPLVAAQTYGTLFTNSGNTFLGGETPKPGFSGTEAVFVGDRAGGGIKSGNFIVAVGHDACGIGAGIAVTGADQMTCIGTDAGRNIGQGATRNTLVGTNTGKNITGTDNFLGQTGLSNFTSASGNVMFLGGDTLVSGTNNVVLGFQSDVANGTTNSAIVLGWQARGPSSSVVIGQGAGSAGMTGSGVVLIGQGVGSTNCGGTTKVILIGTTSSTECTTNNENSTIHIGNNSTDIFASAGTSTATTSRSAIAGGFQIGSASLSTLATMSGGEFGITKITDSGTAPGAGYLKMSIVAGTTTGTCKIIARAGTSTTPITIVDNVGSGC